MNSKETCVLILDKAEDIINKMPELTQMSMEDFMTIISPEHKFCKNGELEAFIAFYLKQRYDLVIWHYGGDLRAVQSIKKVGPNQEGGAQ